VDRDKESAGVVRIELAFEGGQIVSALVAPETADSVERAVMAGSGGALVVETVDGQLTVVVPRIAYLKRYARDTRAGFGNL
jgi:hypothetical protein